LDLRVACGANAVIEEAGFEVEIELDGFDCVGMGELCAFEEHGGFFASLPHPSDALERH
jgi:hypothetical protein